MRQLTNAEMDVIYGAGYSNYHDYNEALAASLQVGLFFSLAGALYGGLTAATFLSTSGIRNILSAALTFGFLGSATGFALYSTGLMSKGDPLSLEEGQTIMPCP